MKCPHCKEELGLNNICINPICSYFGTTVNFSDKDNLNINKITIDDKLNLGPNDHNKYDSTMYADLNYTHTAENDDISTEEFTAFIGNRKTYYYLGYIHKIKNNNIFVSWNWPCFLLGPYWLLYRKLYALGAIYLIFSLSSSSLFGPRIPGVILLAIRILLAMFANNFYLKHSMKKIKAIKSTIPNLNSNQYLRMLAEKGGVNLLAPLVLLGVYIIIIIVAMISFAIFSTNISPIDFSTPSYQY